MTQPLPDNTPTSNPIPAERTDKHWYDNLGCVLALAVAIIAVLVVGSCSIVVGAGMHDSDRHRNAKTTFTYRIGGDVTQARVSYQTAGGNSSEEGGVGDGWRHEETVTGEFAAAMTVTSGVDETGTTTCMILDERGEVLNTNSVIGSGASVTCSASIIPES